MSHSPRTLPNGKAISAAGFGCSSVWSKPQFPESEALAILAAAVEHGVRHFDTAPSYAEGEARLGRFLAGQAAGNVAGDLVISTKVGTEHGTHERSFAPERMKESFAGSLKRLGRDHVDILYLHGPSPGDLNEDTFAFFAELKAKGQITYAGVNSFDNAVLERVLASPIDAVMLQYSIADRRSATVMRALNAAGKIVIAGTAMGQGIFNPRTFVPRDATSLWYLLRALKKDPLFLIKGLSLRRKLERTGLPANEAALRFLVSEPAVASFLFGTSKREHLIANAQAARQPLPEAARLILQ